MAVDQIKRLYESMPAALDKARKRFGRPLTLAEKILVADMPVVPLWYSNTTGGYSEKVTNVKFDVFGVPVYTDITRK